MSIAHVATIFSQILQLPDVEANADFFELGGDSLLATRVLSAISREFFVELSFEDFVENPSPKALYSRVVDTLRDVVPCV
jgi:acyl carrier protein